MSKKVLLGIGYVLSAIWASLGLIVVVFGAQAIIQQPKESAGWFGEAILIVVFGLPLFLMVIWHRRDNRLAKIALGQNNVVQTTDQEQSVPEHDAVAGWADEICSAVNPRDGRICEKPKDHTGQHGKNEVKAAPTQPEGIPVHHYFSSWYQAPWLMHPRQRIAYSVASIIIFGVIYALIFSSSMKMHQDCSFHTVTNGTGSNMESHSTYECK